MADYRHQDMPMRGVYRQLYGNALPSNEWMGTPTYWVRIWFNPARTIYWTRFYMSEEAALTDHRWEGNLFNRLTPNSVFHGLELIRDDDSEISC